MATVKKASVPPTHPTVWAGLALAVVGLLFAVYAYTGARVYSITFAFIALAGALLALVGILVAAWGRAMMASRASRARRATISADALAIARPSQSEPDSESAPELSSEDAPTVAAPREKKGAFAFSLSRGEREKEKEAPDAIPAGVFAFKRREPARAPERVPEPEPAVDEPLVTLAPPAEPVRVTLRCPQCSTTFSAQGTRPFQATCTSCGFSASI